MLSALSPNTISTSVFEIYGGLMYGVVTNGMANGFLYANTVDPTIGVRYAF